MNHFHIDQQIIHTHFRLYKQPKHCPQQQLFPEIQQQGQTVMIKIRFISAAKRVNGRPTKLYVNVYSLLTDITEPERKTTTEPGTTEGKTTTAPDGIFLKCHPLVWLILDLNTKILYGYFFQPKP